MGQDAVGQVSALQRQLTQAEETAGSDAAAPERGSERGAPTGQEAQKAREAARVKEVSELRAAVAARDEQLRVAAREAEEQRARTAALERRLEQAPTSPGGSRTAAEVQAENEQLRERLSQAEAARARAVQEATASEEEAAAARQATDEARHEAAEARREVEAFRESAEQGKRKKEEDEKQGGAGEEASAQKAEDEEERRRLQARVEGAEAERARLQRVEAERLEYDRRMAQDEQARVFEAHKLRLCMHIQRERQRLIDLFRGLDENGDGLLSREEFLSGFDRLHLGLPRDMLDSLFQEADEAGRGHVDFAHFISTFERNFRLARTAMPSLLDVVVQEAIRAERSRWRLQRDTERAKWAGEKAVLEQSLETTRSSLRRERSRRSSTASGATRASRGDAETGSVTSTASTGGSPRGGGEDKAADVEDWCEEGGLDPQAVAAGGGAGGALAPRLSAEPEVPAARSMVGAAATTVAGAAKWGHRRRCPTKQRGGAVTEAPCSVAAEGSVEDSAQAAPLPNPLKDLRVRAVYDEDAERGCPRPSWDEEQAPHAPEADTAASSGDEAHRTIPEQAQQQPEAARGSAASACGHRSRRDTERDAPLPAGFLGSFTAAARALALQTASVTRLGAVRGVEGSQAGPAAGPSTSGDGATPGELRAQLFRLKGLCDVVLRGADRLGGGADAPCRVSAPPENAEDARGAHVVGTACSRPGDGPLAPTARPSTAPARGSATDVVHTLRRLAQARRERSRRGEADAEGPVSLGVGAASHSGVSSGAVRLRRAFTSHGRWARPGPTGNESGAAAAAARPSIRDHAIALDLRVGDPRRSTAQRRSPQRASRQSARRRAKLAGHSPSSPTASSAPAPLLVSGADARAEWPPSHGPATGGVPPQGGRPRPGSACATARPLRPPRHKPAGEPPAVILASPAPRERDPASAKEARVRQALSDARRQRRSLQAAALTR